MSSCRLFFLEIICLVTSLHEVVPQGLNWSGIFFIPWLDCIWIDDLKAKKSLVLYFSATQLVPLAPLPPCPAFSRPLLLMWLGCWVAFDFPSHSAIFSWLFFLPQIQFITQQEGSEELAHCQPEGWCSCLHHVPPCHHELSGEATVRNARRQRAMTGQWLRTAVTAYELAGPSPVQGLS